MLYECSTVALTPSARVLRLLSFWTFLLCCRRRRMLRNIKIQRCMQHPMPLHCHNLFKTSIIGSHVFMNMHAFELINDFGALFSLFLFSSCRIFRPKTKQFIIRAQLPLSVLCDCNMLCCYICLASYANIWTSLALSEFTRLLEYFALQASIQCDFRCLYCFYWHRSSRRPNIDGFPVFLFLVDLIPIYGWMRRKLCECWSDWCMFAEISQLLE